MDAHSRRDTYDKRESVELRVERLGLSLSAAVDLEVLFSAGRSSARLASSSRRHMGGA